ncbi:50S ribosomal protein L1 [endosymbiont of Euscepes postfasciatus]|uniref:hypothetical protein n=1 Tax=endosymbiont of Euscepes postfasciatus TaxID=650377 RepID=UPI000DC70D26|nr:hypothetical protein [endosymbiont of Euscepes postfasciatus]BBA84702.1 50S ribosomal protein L1 [endosymbiont of Euscepes postfasciatus]
MNNNKNEYIKIIKNINKEKIYNLNDSINILKSISYRNFIENIEIVIVFNLKLLKINFNNLYGNCLLPYSNGIFPKIYIISLYEDKNNIEKLGFNFININDNNIKKLNFKFSNLFFIKNNIYINNKNNNFIKNLIKYMIFDKKYGNLINNYDFIEDNIKNGKKIFYRCKNGILNLVIGKINYKNEYLVDNIISFYKHLLNNKIIINNKKNIFKKIYITSTMGISLKINI